MAFVHIAKALGPDAFGKFSFAQVVALYFLYLADFGLQTLGTRVIAQERSEMSRRVWEITLLRLGLAALCFVALVGLSFIIPQLAEVQTLIIVFGLALFPSAVLLEWFFQGIERMEYVGIGRVIRGAIFALFVLPNVSSASELNYAAIFYVVGIGIAAAVLMVVYVAKFGVPRGSVANVDFKGLLKSAVPLATGSFIAQINYNFGTIALGLYLSDQIVGLFSAAYKISLFLWAFVVVAAANAILPMLARVYADSVTRFSDLLARLLKYFVLVAIPTGIGGTLLAPGVMEFLYSSEYNSAAIVLQVSIWSITIVLFRVVYENALIAARNQKMYFVGYAAGGAITVFGNLILVPIMGLLAPVVISLFAEGFMFIFFAVSCRFIRPSYVLRVSLKPLLAGMLMGAVLWILPMNIFVAIVVGAGLYAALILLLQFVTVGEVVRYARSLVQ